MEQDDALEPVQKTDFPLKWVNADGVQVFYVNAFNVVGFSPTEIIVNLGHAAIPIANSRKHHEQVMADVRENGVATRVVGRITMAAETAAGLAEALRSQEHVANAERRMEGQDD